MTKERQLSNRRYYLKNRERLISRAAILQKTEPYRIKAAERYIREGFKHRLRLKKTYLVRKEQIKKKVALWAKNNPAKRKEICKRWRTRHPDKMRIIYRNKHHRRRCRLKVNYSIKERKTISAWEQSWRNKTKVSCYWCERYFEPRKCHVDHINPISKGGLHSTDNLCISCASCNKLKGNSLLDIWNKRLTSPVLL